MWENVWPEAIAMLKLHGEDTQIVEQNGHLGFKIKYNNTVDDWW